MSILGFAGNCEPLYFVLFATASIFVKGRVSSMELYLRRLDALGHCIHSLL